ncbi:MAG: aminopeptidase P N-terminal domain-containing protein [Planctomycetota bacterium]
MKTIMAIALAAMFLLPTEPDRTRKCGLGSAFHSGRRAALRAKLGDGLVLVRGLPPTRDYTAFRQDKTFWYLTGVESPNAALLMDARSGEEILFLPKPNKMSESWEGELWDTGDDWVKEVTGFRDLRPIGDLTEVLKEKTAAQKVVWTSSQPHVELAGCFDRAKPYDRQIEKDPLDGRISREKALAERLAKDFGAEVKDMREVLDEMRRVKTAEEIDAIRRASHAGSMSMIEAIRSTRPGLGEWEIEALMTFVHRRAGADGPAYHAIVGSGPNALALHYSASSRVMNAGEMLLIDYAPELDHYTSDITRSWPIDGKLTPRMEEIYRAVLAAQEAGIAAVKPGKTMGDVDRACRAVLKEHGMEKLMPHGACHYVGLEVHDVGRGNAPLEPGVVFTVEPGVYEPATGIGVRIEDVVVVTEDGCEVLSAGVPKALGEVLRLCAEEGLLDRAGK